MEMNIKTESLLYWFLRLNGFLTIRNFLVHDDYSSDPLTEIDVAGVRFPHRKENLEMPMEDIINHNKIMFLIGDAKNSSCKRNGPWKHEKVIAHILSSLGFPNNDSTDLFDISNKLITQGFYEGEHAYVSYIIVGKEKYETKAEYIQYTWEEVKSFIFCRFYYYKEQKKNNVQWDADGRGMWNLFEFIMEEPSCKDKRAEFIERLIVIK